MLYNQYGDGMKNKKMLLEYLKNKDIIILYQSSFDKFLDLSQIDLISNKDIDSIICENKYESIIRLYETINNVKISENIKDYIYSLSDANIIKYCLRLAVSQDFSNDELKLDYIKALSLSNESVVKYTYQVAASNLYNSSSDGIKYVEAVGKCNEVSLLSLMHILHSKKYRDDDELLPFINLVKDVDKDYIIEYMVDLFKNGDSDAKRIPLSYISILMSSKGITQAKYVNKILCEEELVKREDISIIALLIAMCDEEDKIYKVYEIIKDKNMANNEQLFDIIYNIINYNMTDSKVKIKEKHK